jgi:pimeloyl-ACP methyl ester carboxylesterase
MTAECTVQANGIELCYETFGSPDDEPLLLVMGLGAQMTTWPVELCDGLVDRGFYVIRYDNRDAGRSTYVDDVGGDFMTTFLAASQGQPVEVPYRLSDLAADGMGLLDALGVDAAHIVGASMGGMIAQTMAIEHPTRALSLTSIMSTTGEPEVGAPDAEALQVLLRPPATSREEAIEAAVHTSRVITGPEHFDEAVARQRGADAYDRAYNPAGTVRQLLAILASGSRAEGLAALDLPTLVIHGDVDPLVTVSGGRRTAELVPGAELIILEGAGHDLPLIYLGQIIDAITALAKRAVGGR